MKNQSRRIVLAAALALAACATALAQTAEDRKTLEHAQSMYDKWNVPGSISCAVKVDWDGFFAQMKIPMDDASKARVETLKSIKISVVTLGQDKTEVKFDGPVVSTELSDGIRQQLAGFFQVYWSLSYGNVLKSKPGDTFDLTRVANGFLLKTESGSTKAEIDMSQAYQITAMRVTSPQMNAAMKTDYKAGTDGLYRLHDIDETVSMGETKVAVTMTLDYQTVGKFQIPQHLEIGLPGSVSFSYVMSGCEVKGSDEIAPTGKH